MKKITVFILFSILLIACSKDTVKTPGQITADELSAVAKQHNIAYVVIHESVSQWNYSGIGPYPFGFDGPYLKAGTDSFNYYNLEKLSHFKIGTGYLTGGSPVPALELYFQ